MTQVGFKGSGTASISDDQINLGQGLQIGNTEIDFATGKIKRNNETVSGLIGSFRTFKKQSKDSDLAKTFVFKAKTKCTIRYQKTEIEYNLINEYVVLNGINTDKIEIERSATGITVDVYDWDFIASDDPNFKISIEKGTRDSDIETVFSSLSRVVDTYNQTVNVQGAKKLILIGKATAGTGTVTITGEVFDPASQSWVELVPVKDIFTLVDGETKVAQIGDTISRSIPDDEKKFVKYLIQTGGNPTIVTDIENDTQNNLGRYIDITETLIGYVLPSGDNLFRIKTIVSTSALTFSLSAIKVFD